MNQITPVTRLADAPVSQAIAHPKRRKLLWASAATAAILLAGGSVWVGMHRQPPPAAMAAALPEVDVSTPLIQSLAQTTDFTGQFSAVDQVDLRAQVSGYLTEIHFTDGQVVQKGALLFVIDPRPYAIALQRAVAQYQTAVTSLDLATKEVSRTTELARHSFASKEVLDQRTQAQQAATAAIDLAKADVNAAQLNLEFTHITAPFGGRVSMRQVSIGSLVTGGAGSAGTSLTSIVSLDPIHLDFDMSEADYRVYQRFQSLLQPGMDSTVQVNLGDERGSTREGKLTFIDNQVDRGSGTLHARATLANADLSITPGQFARLKVTVSMPRSVMLVPDAAIVSDQSRKLLMVVDGSGTVVAKPVEVGALEGDDLRIVTKGIARTDRVVIGGLRRVRPGAKVSPKPGVIAVASVP